MKFTLLVAVSLFTSCGTNYLKYNRFRLEPIEHSNKWYMGKAVYLKKEADVSVNVSFDHVESSKYQFDISFINNSENDILINPSKFRYVSSDSLIESGIEPKGFEVPALDPEKILERVNYKKALEKDRYSQSKSVDATMGFLGLLVDLATIGEDKTQEDYDREAELSHRKRLEKATEEQLHTSRLKRYAEERNYFETSLLRKHSLEPKKAYSGKVFFPIITDRKYLYLIIPIERRNENSSITYKFNFPFKKYR